MAAQVYRLGVLVVGVERVTMPSIEFEDVAKEAREAEAERTAVSPSEVQPMKRIS